MKVLSQLRIVVIFNRDFEGAEADPENKSRDDIKQIAEDVVRILGRAGYAASGLGVSDDVVAALGAIKELDPVVVFNLCESIHGDNHFEPLLPLLFELEEIPFTGTGSFGLSLALRKDKTKEVLRARGVPVPRGMVAASTKAARASGLGFPVIVKPVREDASVGISSASVVHDPGALAARLQHVLSVYRQPALIEEFIDGREIYVSLLGRPDAAEPQIFPYFEIDFSAMPPDRPRIVSFEGKWLAGSVEYRGTRPVRCEGLPAELRARVAATALAAFEALDLRDYARVDIRLSAEGTPYVIDVNPNCDLSDLAGGFSKAAKAGGLTYKDVILRIADLALARGKHADTISLARRSRSLEATHSPGDGRSLPAGGGVVRARSTRRGTGTL